MYVRCCLPNVRDCFYYRYKYNSWKIEDFIPEASHPSRGRHELQQAVRVVGVTESFEYNMDIRKNVSGRIM